MIWGLPEPPPSLIGLDDEKWPIFRRSAAGLGATVWRQLWFQHSPVTAFYMETFFCI